MCENEAAAYRTRMKVPTPMRTKSIKEPPAAGACRKAFGAVDAGVAGLDCKKTKRRKLKRRKKRWRDTVANYQSTTRKRRKRRRRTRKRRKTRSMVWVPSCYCRVHQKCCWYEYTSE